MRESSVARQEGGRGACSIAVVYEGSSSSPPGRFWIVVGTSGAVGMVSV